MRHVTASSARAKPTAMGARFYRVGELMGYVHELFAADAVLSDVWVAGEITDLVQSAAGHIYFAVRDQDSRIPAVMFRSAARRQTLPLVAGYQALIHGSVSLYAPRSTVQLVADIVLPGDAGRLQAELEALRMRLEHEGLFAPERKRALPYLPRRIGVVTSESGAVIHDMLNVWSRRYRDLDVVFAPAVVQGEDAPRQIVAAFTRLHEFHVGRMPLDLVILARGGGSAEELAIFNDERVARAVFACPVPVVSAVGHEVNTTLVDLVADVRASTPSAAAEMVVPDALELRREVDRLAAAARAAVRRRLDAGRREVSQSVQRLESRSPTRVLAERRRDVDELATRATRSVAGMITLARSRVDGAAAQIDALNPLAILQRGFAVAMRDADGRVLLRAQDIEIHESFTVRLAEGAVRGEAVDRLENNHQSREERHGG